MHASLCIGYNGRNDRPPPKKSGFELFGLDFVLTKDNRLLMYEANAGPCVKKFEKPMISQMLDICLPWGVEAQGELLWEEIRL